MDVAGILDTLPMSIWLVTESGLFDRERHVAEARREAHPNAPVFFLSYARVARRAGEPARDVNEKRHQFFLALSDHIHELMGLEAGSRPGFIDDSMDGGQVWTEELAFAIGHCQVFVPLLSQRYLRSEWCAREWDAFTRRPVVPNSKVMGAGKGTSVIPVIWTVVQHADIPLKISRVQRFAPTGLPSGTVEDMYEREGIYGLPQLGAEGREAYEAAVWRLAQRIVRATHERWVKPRVPTDMHELRADFEEDAA